MRKVACVGIGNTDSSAVSGILVGHGSSAHYSSPIWLYYGELLSHPEVLVATTISASTGKRSEVCVRC